MKIKPKESPTISQKTSGRCINIGEALSESYCHLNVAQDIIWNLPVKKQDTFPWRTISGAIQGLRELKKNAPGLGNQIKKVEKDTKSLQYLIYRTPTAKERIRKKLSTVMDGFLELRRSARAFCADPPKEPLA